MELIKSVLTIAIFSVFSGCSYNGVPIPILHEIGTLGDSKKVKIVYKKKYIKNSCPKRAKVRRIPTYTIIDKQSFNDVYWLIGKADFTKYANTCKKLRTKIMILEQ